MNHKRMNELMEEENAKWPARLKKLSKSEWPATQQRWLMEVWRSRGFLVQVYYQGEVKRLSVCRTTIKQNGNWAEEITWNDLQALKEQCGYGDKAAVEIYPPDKDIVNAANMRHLWVLDTPPDFMWKD